MVWIVFVRATVSVQSWSMLALVAGACLAIGAVSGWCVALSKSERAAIDEMIGGWWRRVRRRSVDGQNIVTPRPLGR